MKPSDVPRRLVEDGTASDEARRVLAFAAVDRPSRHVLDGALTRFLRSQVVVAPPSPRTMSDKGLVLLGIGALILAGATVAAWYASAPAPESLSPETSRRESHVVISAPEDVPSVESRAVPSPPQPLADVDALPSAAAAATKEAATRRRPRASSSREPSSVKDDDTFDAELRKLHEARARLTSGHALAALAELDVYDRMFPKGALVPEAQAMRIDALVAAGRADEAIERAETFVRTYPRSPQSARFQRILERQTR